MTGVLTGLIVLASLASMVAPASGAGRDDPPRTRPERTDNAETSTLEDVGAFLDALVAAGAPLRLATLGTSPEGREIPLVVCADPMVEDGAAARASGRVVIYLQANIHGGEVEGKEAVLMILREITQGQHRNWLERCVIVCTPVYNTDGNEAWGAGLKNRSHQNGPARIGQRANGAGLDLNRDAIKAESPEMRAALTRIYRHWDPHLTLDLHTTNGTRHGYTLTYAPPLHPDTEAGVLTFARDTLLPEVRRQMQEDHGEATNDYGNVEERDGARGWYTFSPLGRYVTNYVGLRNRVAVLSEATSYLPLDTRIASTRHFVSRVLDVATERAAELAEICREADRRVASGEIGPLALAFTAMSRGEESIPLESPEVELPPHSAPGEMTVETLPFHDRFQATKSRALPRAYWLPAAESGVIALLRRHGVEVEPWRGDDPLEVEEFAITTVRRGRPFQGRRMIRLAGEWRPATLTAEVASGGYRVTTAQPLAVLIFHLLEPDHEDGAAAWNVLSSDLEEGEMAPMRRIP